MAASTILRDSWTNDTGTAANPNADGTVIQDSVLQNHIYARIDAMFTGAGAYATFTFGGLLKVEGFGTHLFSAGGSGQQTLTVRNTAAGVGNSTAIYVANDASVSAGVLVQTSSTFTSTNQFLQDALVLNCSRAGGISIAAEHASGTLRFYSGGTTKRMEIDNAGRVGINQNAGTAQVEVTAPSGRVGLAIQGVANQYGLQIVGSITTGQSYGVLIIGGTDASDYGLLIQRGDGADVRFKVRGDGQLQVGHNASSTNMVGGLSLNQGSEDGEIMAMQSTDIAHGMTTDTDTSTFALFRKAIGTDGGLVVRGLSETVIGLILQGTGSTTDNTKSTAGSGAVLLVGDLKNASTSGSLGANNNLLAVRDFGTTRFILDSDGDSHQDVGTAWTNFDDHDDVALLTALSAGVSRHGDPVRQQFGQWVQQYRETLEQLHLVTFNQDGHHFVNWSRLSMLKIGAIRQLAQQIAALNQRLAALEAV